jgi:hypothetical protein
MWTRRIVCLVVLSALLSALAPPAAAAEGDKIVRTKAGLDGSKVINSLCALRLCTVVRALDTLPGQTQSGSLYLVRGLLDTTVSLTLSLLGIQSIEPDRPVAVSQDLSSSWTSTQASAAVVDQLWDRTPMSYYGSSAWESYLRQPASDIVRLRDTHCDLRQTGAGIVAVIDTGVDPNHPTLKPVLVDGYDFVGNRSGGSETSDVQQASAAVVDGEGVNWVSPSTAAVLDQASAAVVDDSAHSAFGHGTMVAGVIHLTAPTARIMPLKAFGPDGQGWTSDILRAVYYAAGKGAKVVNMSFSRPTSSPELKRAIDTAAGKGLIAVAAAGNDGAKTLVYPAAYDNVIGVASTTNDDLRSSFSNYGSSLVSLAAPGEGIITTYPWGSFAATAGTSFSAPFLSGTVALLAGMQSSATLSQVSSAIAHAKPLTADLGWGRLQTYQTVEAGRALWPSAPLSAVPASCDSSDVDWTVLQ